MSRGSKPERPPGEAAWKALLASSPAAGQVAVLWLGQSGFGLRLPGATVLVDPFLSPRPDRLVRPVIDPRWAAGADVIACTHEHLDHLDLEALPALAGAAPRATVLVPSPITGLVTGAGIPAERVQGLQPGVPWRRGPLTVHAVTACHGVSAGDAYTLGRELSGGAFRYLGYAFRASGLCVYHAGDTIDHDGLADQLRELGVDVALLPINGRDAEREARDIVGNLDPVEAARLAAAAGVRVVLPMHYDMFARNPGEPGLLVEAVRRRHPELSVLMPARGRVILVGPVGEGQT